MDRLCVRNDRICDCPAGDCLGGDRDRSGITRASCRASDLEEIGRVEGLFEGILSTQQLAAFERLVDARLAYRSWEGPAGFFCGLARVRLTPS